MLDRLGVFMKKKNKIGIFFGILLSILYSVGLIIIIVLFFASTFTKGNLYTDILKNIDLNKVKLSSIDPRLANTFGKDITLEEAFINTLSEKGIDSSVAKEIANNPEIKEVVGEFVGDCINYSINQETLPEIKEKDVDKILNNIDINTFTEEKVNKEQILDYVEEINKNTKDLLMEGSNYVN